MSIWNCSLTHHPRILTEGRNWRGYSYICKIIPRLWFGTVSVRYPVLWFPDDILRVEFSDRKFPFDK